MIEREFLNIAFHKV